MPCGRREDRRGERQSSAREGKQSSVIGYRKRGDEITSDSSILSRGLKAPWWAAARAHGSHGVVGQGGQAGGQGQIGLVKVTHILTSLFPLTPCVQVEYLFTNPLERAAALGVPCPAMASVIRIIRGIQRIRRL